MAITPMATSVIVAEECNVSVDRFSIAEGADGSINFTGLELNAADRESLEMLLSIWKYGLVDGGGEPPSSWSAEKLQSARVWLAAHRGDQE